MSLESDIQELQRVMTALTEQVRMLVGLYTQAIAAKGAAQPSSSAQPATASTSVASPAQGNVTPIAGTGKRTTTKAAQAAQSAADPAPAAIDYEQIRAALMDLSKAKGPDAAVAIFSHFKVNSGKEWKPEQYPLVMQKIQEARAS